MIKCEKCSKNEAVFKVLDTKTNKELLICEWCEESSFLPIADLKEPNAENTTGEEGISRLGRLHLIQKSRKEALCRKCQKIIPTGSSCYSQHIEKENMPFPEQSKVCLLCGEELIKQGTEVVLPKSKSGTQLGTQLGTQSISQDIKEEVEKVMFSAKEKIKDKDLIKCKKCGFEFHARKDVFTNKLLDSKLCIKCYHEEEEKENGKNN